MPRKRSGRRPRPAQCKVGQRQVGQRQVGQREGLTTAPTPERRRHGPIEPVIVSLVAAGEIITAQPLRAVSALALLQRRGLISIGERQAGERFHNLFRAAALDNLRASDLMRIPVILSYGNNMHLVEGSEEAKNAIFSALDALGGQHTLGGQCAWYVLGCEMPLNRWAERVDRAGRRVDRHAAGGMLLVVLEILARHFGREKNSL